MSKTQLVDDNGRTIQVMRIKETEVVDGTSASATNTAVTTSTVIRVTADNDCNIAMGSSPTATTTSARLPIGAIEYFKLDNGEQIAVLGANLYVSIME